MMDHCNLLPFEFQRRLLFRSRLWQWSLVWGATTAAVLLLATHRVNYLLGHESRLQHMEQRCEPLRQLVAENRELQQRLREMNSRELLAGELDGARYPLELLGFVSRTAHAFGDQLHVRHFSLSHVARPPKPASKSQDVPVASTEPETICLTLGGLATDGLTIARFVTALRESRVFESVELKSSIPGRVGDIPSREYQLTCTF